MATAVPRASELTPQQRIADGEACRQAALAFQALGWSPTVCCPPDHVGCRGHKDCTTPGKRPLHSWKDHQKPGVRFTVEEINQLFKDYPNANVGMVLGKELVRVDVDSALGESRLQQLSGGDLPPTLEFRSGASDSRGLLYRIPAGVAVRTVTKREDDEHAELRFQAVGAQTVLPPSRHPSGTLYTWEAGKSPWEMEAALMPDWMVDHLRKKEEEPGADRNGSANHHGMDRLVVMSRARAYVKKMPPAISGRGGHDQTFSVACRLMIGFGLTMSEAAEILREYNDRCEPPWTEQEICHKLEDADKQPAGERGYLLSEDPHISDRGNAQRVIQRHGVNFRFCHPWKKWLCWQHSRWEPDAVAQSTWLIKETQIHHYKQVAARVKELADSQDEDRKKELAIQRNLLAHLLKWEDQRRITNCLESMKSEPGVPILPESLDPDHFLFNCRTCTLDLRTGNLRPHSRLDYITKISPVKIDLEATCPCWQKFLDRIFESKTDLISYLQRVIGYSLTGEVSEQCLWFFHGTGANGKSTFLGTILALMGDYGMQSVSELLMQRRNESHPTERADLFGRRFVCTVETEEGKRMAESLMKQMTGGDKVRARKMKQDFFEFQPTHKIFLAANHKPVIRGTDLAVWRRIKLVPFTVTIPEEEKDKNMLQKLIAELPGILTWALIGCLDWQVNGLQEPPVVSEATAAYQQEQDLLSDFLAERTVQIKDAACSVRSGVLKKSFEEYTGESITSNAFSEKMRLKGINSVTGSNGYKVYKNMHLRDGSESES
jgi:putative DNA primase/helicase